VGINEGRYLFQTNGPARDTFPFRLQGRDLVVDAGEFHGITEDAVFDLCDRTQSPVIQGLEVKALVALTTTLQTRGFNRLPEEGLAHLKTRSGVSMSGSSVIISSTRKTRDNWPRFLPRKLGGSGSRRADCDRVELKWDGRCELVVARGSWTSAGSTFELSDTVSLNAGLWRLHAGDSIDFEDTEQMCKVLSAASDFFHHLRRSNGPDHPLREHIKVTSHLLLRDRHGRPAPDGPNLFTKDGVLTPEYAYKEGDIGEHRCYGFTIVNNYHRPLYFWIFVFEMNDLSIGTSARLSWFVRHTHNGVVRTIILSRAGEWTRSRSLHAARRHARHRIRERRWCSAAGLLPTVKGQGRGVAHEDLRLHSQSRSVVHHSWFLLHN
jgi:hypothetical protein